MKKTGRFIVAFVLSLCLLFALSLTAFAASESEPNDSKDQATLLPVGEVMYGQDDDYYGYDEDYYKVSLKKGSSYIFMLQGSYTYTLWNPNGNYTELDYYSDYYWFESDDGSIYYYLLEAAYTGTYYLEVPYSVFYSYSNYQIAVLDAAQLFLQPTISSVNPVEKGFAVTWEAATEATKYAVYRKTSNTDWVQIGATTGTSYTDTSVQSGVSYSYTVRGGKDSQWSDYCEASAYKTFLATTDSITAAKTATGIQVKWNKVTGASGYMVYRRANGGSWTYIAQISDASNTSYLDKAVSFASSYEYKIRTYGAYTTPMSSASAAYLVNPKLTSVSNSKKGIKIKWEAFTGASYYEVYRKAGNGSYKKLINVSPSYNYYEDTSVSAGTSYAYAVKTKVGTSVSGYSNAKSVIRIGQTTGVKVASVSSGLKMKWSKVSKAAGYKVFRKASGGSWKKIATVKSTSYTDKSVKTGTNYSYYVQAYKSSSVGYKSSSATPSIKLSIPDNTLYVGQSVTLKKSGTAGKITFATTKKSVATVSSKGKVVAKKAGTATLVLKGKGYKKTVKVYVTKPSVTLYSYYSTISRGDYFYMSAYCDPSNCKIRWKSSKPSVATVNSQGKVTGKKIGTAKITAYIVYKGKTYKATQTITVKGATPKFDCWATRYYDSITVNISNNGNKTLRVYDDGMYFYSNYTQYMELENGKSYIDIAPYTTKAFKVYPSSGGSLYYNYSSGTLNFKYRYDNSTYYDTLYWN